MCGYFDLHLVMVACSLNSKRLPLCSLQPAKPGCCSPFCSFCFVLVGIVDAQVIMEAWFFGGNANWFILPGVLEGRLMWNYYLWTSD